MDLEERTKKAKEGIKPNSIYFAHPVNTYNTLLEEYLISNIEKRFPHLNVYNPNLPENQENYSFWKKETGNGMKYFFDVILPKMEKGIFLPFQDGMWGKGVAREYQWLKENHKQNFIIYSNGWIEQLFQIKEGKILSVEETRERIKKSYF
jgi:hypothetical protein